MAVDSRKWKADLKAPKLLGLFIAVMALSGFAIGIRGLVVWYQLALGVCSVLCLLLLYLTVVVDPGVITPSLDEDPVVTLLNSDPQNVPQSGYLYAKDNIGQWKRRRQGQEERESERYCTTCNIWRPARAHHCGVCGYCMERFDHHCGVVGTCVARRNHRFFAGFLFFAQIGCALMAAGAMWRLQIMGFPSPKSWELPEMYILLVITVVYIYTALLLIFGMCHCCGIFCDITTKDMVMEFALCNHPPCCSRRRNPIALIRSWFFVLCAPIQSKYSVGIPVRLRDDRLLAV